MRTIIEGAIEMRWSVTRQVRHIECLVHGYSRISNPNFPAQPSLLVSLLAAHRLKVLENGLIRVSEAGLACDHMRDSKKLHRIIVSRFFSVWGAAVSTPVNIYSLRNNMLRPLLQKMGSDSTYHLVVGNRNSIFILAWYALLPYLKRND